MKRANNVLELIGATPIVRLSRVVEEGGAQVWGKLEAVNPGGAASPGGGLDTIVLFGVMLLVFYFLLIRPQQKRSKEHKVLVSGLKRGDEVMTNSGIYGRIQQIDGEVAL